MTLYVVIAGIVLCIFLSYCFSSSEMAFSSSNLMRIRKLSENGNRKAKRAKKLIENFDDTKRFRRHNIIVCLRGRRRLFKLVY